MYIRDFFIYQPEMYLLLYTGFEGNGFLPDQSTNLISETVRPKATFS